MTLEQLAQDIRRSWCAFTSNNSKGWSSLNPAEGQCAVTALAVQHILGGDLLRTLVNGESHYANRLPDGQIVDLTWEQFIEGTQRPLESDWKVRDRRYVLSFPSTLIRYSVLMERMFALADRPSGSRQ